MCDLIIIGGGGHAKVIADIAVFNDYNVRGFLDDNISAEEFFGYRRLGSICDCIKYQECFFVIAIGNNKIRRSIAEKYNTLNYATLIHPTACIGSEVQIGAGTVVMPNTVINASAKVGEFCIVNSGAVIEHECCIGDFTHLSPNCTVCGVSKIGNNCWLGAGSTINNVLSICDDVILGSGAVVIKDITKGGTYVGVPAKITKR